MKKLLFAVVAASLISTSAFAGWWGTATISQITYEGNGLQTISGQIVSSAANYECKLIGDNTADVKKGLLALALTAKTTNSNVNFDAVIVNGGCSIWSLRLE